MDDEFIQFKGVTKKFGKNVVLDNVDITIPEKKIMGIVGASGEGKTTILKIMIGFYKPTKGEVLYMRRNIFKEMKGGLKRFFGFATEDGSFYNDLTVKENLFHYGRLYKMKRGDIRKRSAELIDLVGLSHAVHTLAGHLSMGMKKRLDVAISLIHKPQVLIMDEPTADLDPLLRNHMLALIRKIRDNGTTVVITTQLLTEMDKICDKIAILYNAKIVEQGEPAKIRKKYGETDMDGVFNKIFSKRHAERMGADEEIREEVKEENSEEMVEEKAKPEKQKTKKAAGKKQASKEQDKPEEQEKSAKSERLKEPNTEEVLKKRTVNRSKDVKDPWYQVDERLARLKKELDSSDHLLRKLDSGEDK